jgi:hypothetical protein
VTAAVDVTSDDEPVSTGSTKVASNVTTQQIQALPKGRSFSSLLILSPGVASSGGAAGLMVDGASGSENVFVIDGSEVANFRTGAVNKNNQNAAQRAGIAGGPPDIV